MLPPCFAPVSTVRHWFYGWRDNGIWQTLNYYLLMTVRALQGRDVSPSAGVIDSRQNVVHTADIQDRDGAPLVLAGGRSSLPVAAPPDNFESDPKGLFY